MQDKEIKHIVIVDPGPVMRWAGHYYLPERSYLAYKSYKEYVQSHYKDFTFSLVALEGIKPAASTKSITSLYAFAPHEVALKTQEAKKYLESLSQPAVVLILLKHNTVDFVNLNHKIIFLVEFTPSIRKAMYLAQTGEEISLIGRLRIMAGLQRKDIEDRRAMHKASALQFNGPAASDVYRKCNKNSITFYDHRVSQVPVAPARTKSEKFSVGFSGRLDPMKGSRYMAKLSHELYRLDPSITFYVMGDGSDRQKVLDEAAPNLVYKGFMGYSSEWEPFVQENIDLMVFPHPQGDPSMTYYEALGQGVPVVAFANETSDFLRLQGAAWTVPSGDVKELARCINELARNPAEVEAKARAARDFMRKSLYQDTVARRMEHLVSVARTSYGAQ